MQFFSPDLVVLSPRTSLTGSGGDSLQNVNPTELPNGAICVVPGTGVYELRKASVAAVSAPAVIATVYGAGVAGRWVQVLGAGGASTVTAGNGLTGGGTLPTSLAVQADGTSITVGASGIKVSDTLRANAIVTSTTGTFASASANVWVVMPTGTYSSSTSAAFSVSATTGAVTYTGGSTNFYVQAQVVINAAGTTEAVEFAISVNSANVGGTGTVNPMGSVAVIGSGDIVTLTVTAIVSVATSNTIRPIFRTSSSSTQHAMLSSSMLILPQQ